MRSVSWTVLFTGGSGRPAHGEDIAFAYSSDIANLLARQLEKFATLNPHQLAGQVANLDFWLDEVAHALAVIDGYRARFDRLSRAWMAHAQSHGTVEFALHDPFDPHQPPQSVSKPKRVPSEELAAARRDLGDATYRFLIRCYRDGFLDEPAVRARCKALEFGVDLRDFRA